MGRLPCWCLLALLLTPAALSEPGQRHYHRHYVWTSSSASAVRERQHHRQQPQLPAVKCADKLPDPHPCSGVTGPRQSPINIDTCGDTVATNWKPLKFTNFDTIPQSMSVMNLGDRVIGNLTWPDTRQATVSGGQLPGTYVWDILSLHWGANNSFGSEHAIDGHHYTGELHFGLRNIKYPTIDEAFMYVDGVIGIAVFLDDKVRSPGRGIGALAPALHQIKNAFASVEVDPAPRPREWLPRNVDSYVQYDGSPSEIAPCPETATWIIMRNPIRVEAFELQLLRDLRDRNGERICTSIIRPVQPVRGRQLLIKGPRRSCP